MNKCPFKAGDYVIYKPSQRGHDLDDGVRLEIGRKYRVTRIEQDNYVVIEGYQHPGGGLYWTEFEKASE
jgi:hypothetical protein